MGNFKTLRVWQDALNLAEKVYLCTKDEKFSRDFGLKDQIQRAAVSVASNIAEGDERKTLKEAIYFLNVAKGSTAEVITQLHIAYRIGYLDQQSFAALEDFAEKVRASIKNLIRARSKL